MPIGQAKESVFGTESKTNFIIVLARQLQSSRM